MTGSVIIDGFDISAWGMFILREGDYDLLSFPDRKQPDQDEWFEENGVDPDLSGIYFKEKRITLLFYIKGATGDEFLDNLSAFYRLISAPGYRQLYSREFGRTFTLRYLSCPAYTHKGGMFKPGTKRGRLPVEFSMDDPLQAFTNPGILIPRNGRSQWSYVRINGIDLAAFGIIVTQCYNTVLQLPAVKASLMRSFARRTGLMYFAPEKSTFRTRQIVIECTMIAANREDFYYNYEALFNNLTVKQAVTLSTFAGDNMECYYTSMTNFQKLKPFSGGKAKVSFNLVLEFIRMKPKRIFDKTFDKTFN